MSDADKARLLFLENLSTADSVSDVSGRGVGMSAVADVVHNLGGKIEIFTKPGQGTAFEISIPKLQSAAEVAPTHLRLLNAS